jgi:membrane-associated phospholipid phosphatase
VLSTAPALNPSLFTDSAAAADRWLFGGATFAPTASAITTPLVAELLQLAYATYYLLPLFIWIEMLAARRLRSADLMALVVVGSLFVSYWGYVAFPTAPPATSDATYTVALEHLTPVGTWVHATIDAGEPYAHVRGESPRVYDCFPSGHTMLSLLTAWMAWRCRSRFRWPITVLASLIVLATVYLRYHWVIDVIAGVALAVLLVWLLPRAYRLWETWSQLTLDEAAVAPSAPNPSDA